MQITEKPSSPFPQASTTVKKQPPLKSFGIPVWRNLSIRWKATILLILAGGIPVLIVTQVNSQFARTSYLETFKSNLGEKGRLFTTDFVLWGLGEAKTEAEAIAQSVESGRINPSDPTEVTKNQIFLQSLLQISQKDTAPESIKNFKLITNAQGQTVAQIAMVMDPVSANPKLLPLGEISQPVYRVVNLPKGLAIADLEIVKQTLSTGKSQSGTELVRSSTLKTLGLENQAAIAPRPQATQGLTANQAPSPEGTFDIEGGKIGLANIAVTPITVNGRVVGTVVVGGLLNRNAGILEGFQKKLNVPTSTIFAQDFRVSTTTPYVDPATKKPDGTSAIGTRVAAEVANQALKSRQTFLGETNLVGVNYLAYYEPLYDHQNRAIGIAATAKSLAEIEANVSSVLFQGYSVGLVSVILIGLLAGFLANAITKPLEQLSDFSKQIGTGDFDGQKLAETNSTDEIGVLNAEMHKMATSIQANSQSSKLQLAIAGSSRASQDILFILDIAVGGAKEVLGADRVVVYQFNEGGGGTIVSEAVSEGLPKALNDKIEDACISQDLIEAYKKGRVVPTQDVFNAGFHPDHLNLMKRLRIKSNLVTPIVIGDQLLGLLIAHFCYDPHNWQDFEINILRQSALQVGLAIERLNFIQTQQQEAIGQKQQKEMLQRRAMELLIAVDPISQGDLTVRAKVTEDEIGTVADSYNATVGNLRRIVAQVQTAAKLMADTTSSSESSVLDLSKEAVRQSEELALALDRIQEMSQSTRTVTASAQAAEGLVKQSAITLQEGDNAMNLTVEGILAIRSTVAETSKKVKRLGESSQKISKVVNLISSFAEQTNLLALNAAIEAARAGEEGRGFGVVADRVRSLAKQSTNASREIEVLVAEIQSETNEVVTAMEVGTEQVVIGTRLVEDARQNLTKIAEASIQINTLVEAIAQAALAQSKTSAIVTDTITDVAAIALSTSTEANQVSNTFKDLLQIAQELQKSVGQFKV